MYVLRLVGHGFGVLPKAPPIADDPVIAEMRQAERNQRAVSVLMTRDLRHDELAKLQKRLHLR